ncbi:N-acetylmuramoyl-L-alanine amidase [uncultured Albimonas sp.]|uniref:N-acetylmuramoyl-L-alanine amidase n=1 Tax=uncultured Albimonas sp. TaxID=1331701 RepID=UPI0030EE3B65
MTERDRPRDEDSGAAAPRPPMRRAPAPPEIVEIASPNHGPRRGVAAPNMILIHYTNMSSAALALARLCNPAAEVSAHYLIDETGGTFRMVSEMRRAWHAGVAAWGPVEDVNSHSIGIELANPGPEAGLPPFPEAQLDALERLLFAVRLRWAIPPARVLGHSDVAVGRKIDPGEKFPWQRLARAGHAIWSQAEAPDPAPFLPPETLLGVHALKLGYRWQETEAGFADLVRALQMRFAPDETGAPASHRLAARVAEMAGRFPVADGERRSSYAPPGPSGRVHVSAPRPGEEDGGFDPDFDLDTE